VKLVTPADTAARTYRGRFDQETEENVLEVLNASPTWNDVNGGRSRLLRQLPLELSLFEGDEFNWGYFGSGSLLTSHAILLDALGAQPDHDMCTAFCREVVAQLCDFGKVPWLLQWRLVYRWARAWHLDQQ
jgi:hypothetical protein